MRRQQARKVKKQVSQMVGGRAIDASTQTDLVNTQAFTTTEIQDCIDRSIQPFTMRLSEFESRQRKALDGLETAEKS